MSLRNVLWVKIGCTVVLWAGPLLLAPARAFCWVGMPPPEPMFFIRLLGAAFTALVVGYYLGLRDLERHHAITPVVAHVVWVGIVSNGLACLILLIAGVTDAWTNWGIWARMALWASTALTGAITLGLVWCGLYRRR